MHKIIEQVCDQYLNPKNAWMYEREVHRAMDEFLGAARNGPLPEVALPFFADWFVFDFPMEGGETPLKRFYSMNPIGLSRAELADCKQIIDENRYDFFQVITNKKGRITVSGVREGGEFTIADKAFNCPVGDVFVSRIIPRRDAWSIASMDPIGLPHPSTRDVARIRNEFPILDPRIVYQEIVAVGDANMSMPLEVQKMDGDLVVATGGDTHADDDCPVCLVLQDAKRKNRVPTEKELDKAFKEANKRDSHKK